MIHRVLTVTANAFDRAMVSSIGARNRRRRGEIASVPLDEKLKSISEIAEYYRPYERDFFATGETEAEVQEQPIGDWIKHIKRVNLRWQSQAKVLMPRLREAYEGDTYNAQMHARWYGSIGSGRPVAILVHGYLGGDFGWEQRFWPVEMLYSWGFDVAMVALPFHGLRKDPTRDAGPKFPAVDPAWNIEAFRQAIIDLRSLVAFAHRKGHRDVGAFGMSLGGYTSSLLATAEPSLAFCVPMIPLASIPDFVRDHGRFPGDQADVPTLHAALEACMSVVAPTVRPLAIAPERMTILAAKGDGITHPAQAARLAEHFGVEMISFPGGHLLQFGRERALQRVREKLIAQKILA